MSLSQSCSEGGIHQRGVGGPNQALKQTRDSVLRFGERCGRELLNLAVLPPKSGSQQICVRAFLLLVSSGSYAFAAPERREVLR